MTRLTTFGRACFALALAAFGCMQFVYGDFVAGRAPAWPAALPGQLVWAYASGLALVLAGIALVAGKKVWFAGVTAGTMILLWAFVRSLPDVAADVHVGAAWTGAGKALALFGGSLAAAATAPDEEGVRGTRDAFVLAGRVCLGLFLALGGIQHFLYPEFVASLVPSWIPGPVFWTYFAGVALVAGGVGMIVPVTARLAATLSGTMVFLWLLMLHVPRALAASVGAHSRNEWTAVFEALAVSGIAFLLAGLARERRPARAWDPSSADRPVPALAPSGEAPPS